MQSAEVRRSPLAVLGHDLIAGAIKTHGVAERQMEIQRERTRRRRFVAAFRPDVVIGLGETGVELHRRGIRGITRSALVVTADEVGIERQLMRRNQFRHG